jgi:hypothetical protein
MNKSNLNISGLSRDIDRCLEEINNLNESLKLMNKSSHLPKTSLRLINRIVRLQIELTARQYQCYLNSNISDKDVFYRAKNTYWDMASKMVEVADDYWPESPQDLTQARTILNEIQANAAARLDLDHINQLANEAAEQDRLSPIDLDRLATELNNETAEEYDPLIPMISREQQELWYKTKEQRKAQQPAPDKSRDDPTGARAILNQIQANAAARSEATREVPQINAGLQPQPASIMQQLKARAAQTAGESPEPSPASLEAQSTKLRQMLAGLANGQPPVKRSRRRKT